MAGARAAGAQARAAAARLVLRRSARPPRLREKAMAFFRVQKPVRARGSRCSFAAVVGAKLLLLLRPVQQEAAAADPRGFRLDQAEDHLHGDRGVERAAAELQHRVAGFGGERMRRGHHESLGGERFSRIGDKAEKKKGGRDRPSQKRRYRRHQTIKGTISSATMLMILMSGLTAGPAVSL